MRLIALWMLGGPVLQMGGGSTKPGVTPEAWLRPWLLDLTKQRNKTCREGSGKGSLRPELSSWGLRVCRENQMDWLCFLQKFGKALDFILSRMNPAESHFPSKLRVILFGIFLWHESFHRARKEGCTAFSVLTASPLGARLLPKAS